MLRRNLICINRLCYIIEYKFYIFIVTSGVNAKLILLTQITSYLLCSEDKRVLRVETMVLGHRLSNGFALKVEIMFLRHMLKQ